MKTFGMVMTSMVLVLTAACGTTSGSSSGGSSSSGAASAGSKSTYGCEGLTGDELQRCQVRRDAGSASR